MERITSALNLPSSANFRILMAWAWEGVQSSLNMASCGADGGERQGAGCPLSRAGAPYAGRQLSDGVRPPAQAGGGVGGTAREFYCRPPYPTVPGVGWSGGYSVVLVFCYLVFLLPQPQQNTFLLTSAPVGQKLSPSVALAVSWHPIGNKERSRTSDLSR